MSANFPSSPTNGQTYNLNGAIWQYNGRGWQVISLAPQLGATGATGPQGATGTAGTIGVDGATGATGASSNLLAVSSSIIPAANVTYDLGTSTLRWRDLYLSGNSLYIGAATITATGNAVVLPAGTTISGGGALGATGATGPVAGSSGQVIYNNANVAAGSANLTFDGTTLNARTITENGSPVVVQTDIGTAPNEIPLNQHLGSMAYESTSNYYSTKTTTGFRNRIINGAMIFNQRGDTSTVYTFSGGAADYYSVDRWVMNPFSSSGTLTGSMQQVTDAPNGFTHSLLITSTFADPLPSGRNSIMQRIEYNNMYDLGWGTSNAQPITLSFWAKGSIAGTYSGTICNAGRNISYVFLFTLRSTNTWEKFIITIPGPTTGTWNYGSTSTGMQVRFSLGITGYGNISTIEGNGYSLPFQWLAGNTWGSQNTVNIFSVNGATFNLTGVQVEKGTVATDFDWRPNSTELALCQRYYAKLTSGSTTYAGFGFGSAGSTTVAQVYIKFPQTMRASPTINQSTTQLNDYNAASNVTISSTYAGLDSAQQILTATGLTQYRPYIWIGANSTSAYVDLSAEL